jgi:hypothetical protein
MVCAPRSIAAAWAILPGNDTSRQRSRRNSNLRLVSARVVLHIRRPPGIAKFEKTGNKRRRKRRESLGFVD